MLFGGKLTMMALSIHPEYAWEIFTGEKTIEYRSWQTNYCGPLLICATAHKKRGYIAGHALCVAYLEDIITYGPHDYDWQLAPFVEGKSYHIEPFPVKGQLKLFTVDDAKIHRVSWEWQHDLNSDVAQQWLTAVIEPLIY